MARPDPEERRAANDLPGGLKHNPFAKLAPPGAAATPKQAETAPKAPAPKSSPGLRLSIVVRRERKGRGGKTVTIAEGPGLAGRKLDDLARELARALGTGARAEGSTLVAQGDQTERMVAWLEERGWTSVTRGN